MILESCYFASLEITILSFPPFPSGGHDGGFVENHPSKQNIFASFVLSFWVRFPQQPSSGGESAGHPTPLSSFLTIPSVLLSGRRAPGPSSLLEDHSCCHMATPFLHQVPALTASLSGGISSPPGSLSWLHPLFGSVKDNVEILKKCPFHVHPPCSLPGQKGDTVALVLQRHWLLLRKEWTQGDWELKKDQPFQPFWTLTQTRERCSEPRKEDRMRSEGAVVSGSQVKESCPLSPGRRLQGVDLKIACWRSSSCRFRGWGAGREGSSTHAVRAERWTLGCV